MAGPRSRLFEDAVLYVTCAHAGLFYLRSGMTAVVFAQFVGLENQFSTGDGALDRLLKKGLFHI